MVFLIRLSQFLVATISACKMVCFLYSSFSHFQLSQSAKACKFSTVKVANDCQNRYDKRIQTSFICLLFNNCFLICFNFANKFLE